MLVLVLLLVLVVLHAGTSGIAGTSGTAGASGTDHYLLPAVSTWKPITYFTLQCP